MAVRKQSHNAYKLQRAETSLIHLLDDLELCRELAVLGGPEAGPGEVVFSPSVKSTAFGLVIDLAEEMELLGELRALDCTELALELPRDPGGCGTGSPTCWKCISTVCVKSGNCCRI